jgi:hypothetical protein
VGPAATPTGPLIAGLLLTALPPVALLAAVAAGVVVVVVDVDGGV